MPDSNSTPEPAAASPEHPGEADLPVPPPGAGASDTSFPVMLSSVEHLQDTVENQSQSLLALFQNISDLLEQQNQVLADLDRHLTELAGQVNSLKNHF